MFLSAQLGRMEDELIFLLFFSDSVFRGSSVDGAGRISEKVKF